MFIFVCFDTDIYIFIFSQEPHFKIFEKVLSVNVKITEKEMLFNSSL